MKKLEDIVRKDGNLYTLIKRTNDIASYSVDRKGIRIGYAVFIVKQQKEMDLVMGGVKIHYEHKEIFPGANAYGKFAWYYNRIEDAEKKFNYLVEMQDKKQIEQFESDDIEEPDSEDN